MIGLTQELSETLISPCPLRPLRFDFSLPVRKSCMKNKALNLRISERRLNKLRLYSVQKDTTMTHVIEDFIDSLKLEIGDSDAGVPANASLLRLRQRYHRPPTNSIRHHPKIHPTLP